MLSRDGVVHRGQRVYTNDGWKIFVWCDDTRTYTSGIDAFLVFDGEVDCMTCLVLEARRGS